MSQPEQQQHVSCALHTDCVTGQRREHPQTRYDESAASDGHGGPHPLAGVPQEALDAVTKALTEATTLMDIGDYGEVRVLDSDDVEAVAHAILATGLAAMRRPDLDWANLRVEVAE